MRYIDADKLIEFTNNTKDKTIDANDIARFPAADVVEVVRCKDCKHYISDGGALMICEITEMNTNDCDYCSYGERLDT